MVRFYPYPFQIGLLLVASACVGIASAPLAQPATSNPHFQASIEMGQQIVTQKCQSCHAIGATDVSIDPRAPPLRTLSERYPIDSLAEAFGEGILVGHSNMPEFELEPAQIEALLAYIKSIQARDPPPLKKAKAS
jgi:cytochrome c